MSTTPPPVPAPVAPALLTMSRALSPAPASPPGALRAADVAWATWAALLKSGAFLAVLMAVLTVLHELAAVPGIPPSVAAACVSSAAAVGWLVDLLRMFSTAAPVASSSGPWRPASRRV